MLQKRTMTVWASVTNEDDVAVYRMLSNGVDGVVTNSYSDVHSAMNVFTGNNVLLRLPIVDMSTVQMDLYFRKCLLMHLSKLQSMVQMRWNWMCTPSLTACWCCIMTLRLTA